MAEDWDTQEDVMRKYCGRTLLFFYRFFTLDYMEHVPPNLFWMGKLHFGYPLTEEAVHVMVLGNVFCRHLEIALSFTLEWGAILTTPPTKQ